ncbi:TPA: hypothetical protein F6W26_15295 [Citrobacter amalonaticus]|nr:hypothetical protein [Citrobacter amalonaticus]
MRFLPYRETPQPEHQHNILIFNHLKYTNNKNSIRYKNQAVTEYFIDKKRQNKNISLVDSYNAAIYSSIKQKHHNKTLTRTYLTAILPLFYKEHQHVLTTVTLASCCSRHVRDGCLLFCREHVDRDLPLRNDL